MILRALLFAPLITIPGSDPPPVDGDWQELVIEARDWGDERDPDDTRDDPEDIEDFTMRIDGRFYRIAESEPFEFIKKCP